MLFNLPLYYDFNIDIIGGMENDNRVYTLDSGLYSDDPCVVNELNIISKEIKSVTIPESPSYRKVSAQDGLIYSIREDFIDVFDMSGKMWYSISLGGSIDNVEHCTVFFLDDYLFIESSNNESWVTIDINSKEVKWWQSEDMGGTYVVGNNLYFLSTGYVNKIKSWISIVDPNNRHYTGKKISAKLIIMV